VEDSTPYIIFETDRRDRDDGRTLFFSAPSAVLRLDPGGDPREFFDSIEEEVSRGRWVAGYFTYEMGHLFEARLAPLAGNRVPRGPLAWVGVFDAPGEKPAGPSGDFDISGLRVNTGRDEYTAAIGRIKSHIVAGDTYQVNYTFKQSFTLGGSPLALFEALRERQRVSYAACIDDGERTIISLSPELFFERERDSIRVKPMKGTAGRGADAGEDDELAAWLRADTKNRAENVMIVDMIRNDLGRIARSGGVSVPALFEVDRFETLHQMTSTVEADVPAGTSWFEVFRTLFPCASVTGAPKVRTMELIAGLEKQPRGVYTGAIGYIAPDNSACFNVAIRTAVVDRAGHGEMGIGSGVVFDSEADAEYEECLLKGRFLGAAASPFELVETMRLEDGSVFLLDLHLWRLVNSAARFGYPVSRAAVETRLGEAAAGHPAGRHKVRLLLDAGGRIDVSVTPLEQPVPVMGVRLSAERVDPGDEMLRHKTTHRPVYQREREAALEEGCGEVLFLNTRGEVCEGSITNVFVKTGGVMVTPPVSSGLLPGTLREDLLSNGECRERVLFPDALAGADVVFVGNSVSGLIPVTLDS